MEQAQQAFIDEEFARAEELYTVYLTTHPDDVIALASRAAVYLKLDKPPQAMQDAAKAATLKPDLEVAWYRQGLAAFALEDFARAKIAFMEGKQLLGEGTEPEGRKYATWLRKVAVEMEEGEEGVKEASSVTTTTTTREPAPLTTLKPTTAAALSMPVQPKYQYYQTPTHLTVTLLQKGLKEGEASVVIQPRQLTIKGNDGSTVLLKRQLFEAVIPEESVIIFFATKVEIKLKKVTEGLPWPDLSASSSSTNAASVPVLQPPLSSSSSPSSSVSYSSSKCSTSSKPLRPYASHKDWGAVEREITKELESEKPVGEEALNKLFKDIYSNASDDTRRAMVKSYQTSGGTVLSTNWGEVANKDYEKDEERKAPEGMEWRKWG
ncbi:sgs domain-containing protein [Nannochloropsis oceanica]